MCNKNCPADDLPGQGETQLGWSRAERGNIHLPIIVPNLGQPSVSRAGAAAGPLRVFRGGAVAVRVAVRRCRLREDPSRGPLDALRRLSLPLARERIALEWKVNPVRNDSLGPPPLAASRMICVLLATVLLLAVTSNALDNGVALTRETQQHHPPSLPHVLLPYTPVALLLLGGQPLAGSRRGTLSRCTPSTRLPVADTCRGS